VGGEGKAKMSVSHEDLVGGRKRKYPHRTGATTTDQLEKPVEDNLDVGVYICVEILGSQERKKLTQSIRDKNGSFPHFLLDLRKEPTFAAIIKSQKHVKVGYATLCKQLPLYLMGLLLELEGEEGSLMNLFDTCSHDPNHFWFHINRGVWLLRSLQASALSLSPTARNISDLLPSNRLDYSHTRAVLDTIQLYLSYCIRWLGNPDKWRPLGKSDEMVSHKARIFQLTMNTLSLFEDYFSWTSTDTSFHMHVKDILRYNSLDCLVQSAFTALALVIKEMRLFELEHSSVVGKFEHMWEYESTVTVLKGITRWYFGRLCCVLSFFTRQFLNEAFYCTVAVCKNNVVCILRFMHTALDEALRFALGKNIDIHDYDKYLYILLRVLDLFDVLLEKEELYFLDHAMSHEETKVLLEKLVQTIQRLYVCVCIHIRDKGYNNAASSSYEPPSIPAKLVSTFQASLFRVLEVLGDDSNFREFVLRECQAPTFLLCNVNRSVFYEYWLNIASDKFRSRREDKRNKICHELFGGFEIGIYCLQAREHFDTLAAGLSIYEPSEDRPAGVLVDLWHYEKTLQLYKIILDIQNAKQSSLDAAGSSHRSYSQILEMFSEPENIRGNVSNLLLFAHNQIPSQLLLQEEKEICHGLCQELEIKEDQPTQPNSITFMTGSFNHVVPPSYPPPEASGAGLAPPQLGTNPQAGHSMIKKSEKEGDNSKQATEAAQPNPVAATRTWVARSPIAPIPSKVEKDSLSSLNLNLQKEVLFKKRQLDKEKEREEREALQKKENDKSSKVFVAQIPLTSLKTDVERAMEKFGEISSCRMYVDKQTGVFTGYALVEYSNPNSAALAFEYHQNAKANERLHVNGHPVPILLYQRETPVQKKRAPFTEERKQKVSMALKEAWRKRKQKQGEAGGSNSTLNGQVAAKPAEAQAVVLETEGDRAGKTSNGSNTLDSKEKENKDQDFHIELLFEELDFAGQSPDLLLHFFYEHQPGLKQE
jgi:hypothetical protein